MADDARSTTDLDVSIGLNIKNHRTAQGISQSAIADAIGVSFQQVQKYERGENRISAARLVAIAEALHVTVDRLCARSPWPAHDPLAERREIARISAIWPRLPPHIRRALLDVAEASATNVVS